MLAAERRDAALGAARLLGAGTRRVQELHAGIAGRVFRSVGPASAQVRLVHDTVTAAAYSAVRAAVVVGGRAAGALSAVREDGPPLEQSARARVALAVLNGLYGDQLGTSSLATPMALRGDGQEPTGKVAVFLHGLTETEGAWGFRRDRHGGHTYGSLLRRDLGYSAVWARYSTGLPVDDNGAALDAALEELVRDWPVPVEQLVLIGHSMGGLVTRSALRQAISSSWLPLVTDTVTLGTPHLGAPLEQAVTHLTRLLHQLPETRPVARVLATRSAGIRDLRRGSLAPLHPGPRHFVVLTTMTGRGGALVGDGLVLPHSACGDTGQEDTRLAFPDAHVHRLSGLHHFDLLNHPDVYGQLHRWLGQPQQHLHATPPL
ncbi:MAG: hypothetical protein WCD35_06245 [Mycobacteriales bacterium]